MDKFTPSEYGQSRVGFTISEELNSQLLSSKAEVENILFLFAVNWLFERGYLKRVRLSQLLKFQKDGYANAAILNELADWHSSLKNPENLIAIEPLCKIPLPSVSDPVGLIYQSLLSVGSKAVAGAYYTPDVVVDEIFAGRTNTANDLTVLDPCCGTGQFLLSAARAGFVPENIVGFEVDVLAARVARLNLLVAFKGVEFKPKVYVKNTLLENQLFEVGPFDSFDIVATNPPWGMHFAKSERELLSVRYPEIGSFESFSYFLIEGVRRLKNGGRLSYILPESVLYTQAHQDIRSFLLDSTRIEKIVDMGRIFQNVFTPVIRLDLSKDKSISKSIEIVSKNHTYQIDSQRFRKNVYKTFDIHADDLDYTIDLLHKSGRGQFKVVEASNKPETQAETPAPIAIALGNDAEAFKPADHMLNPDAQLC